jgi:hypothetical protein
MSTHFPYLYPKTHAHLFPVTEDADSMEQLRARYRRSARFVDDLIGDRLEDLDLEHNLVIVTGDHGEALGHDGTIAHASRLSEAQTQVPFVIAGPGVADGAVLEAATEHVDVAPTILALLGFPEEVAETTHGRAWFGPGGATSVCSVAQAAGIAPNQPQTIALLSRELRFLLRLQQSSAGVEFQGKIGEDGRLLDERLTEIELETFSEWFEDYLRRASRTGRAGSVGTLGPAPASETESSDTSLAE